MSTQLKLRRGTTAQHSTFTGAEGEVTVDTTKDTLVVHDGTTAGGVPLLKDVTGSVASGNLAALAVTTAKLADANVTQAKLAAGVAGNGPAFSAKNTASQTGITNAVSTKVLFPSEDFDTNNCFASSTFTPTVAGYYQINASLDIGAGTVGTALCRIYKNGSLTIYGNGVNNSTMSEVYLTANGLLYCNGTTDYIEIYIYMSTSSNIVYNGSSFSAAMIRGE